MGTSRNMGEETIGKLLCDFKTVFETRSNNYKFRTIFLKLLNMKNTSADILGSYFLQLFKENMTSTPIIIFGPNDLQLFHDMQSLTYLKNYLIWKNSIQLVYNLISDLKSNLIKKFQIIQLRQIHIFVNFLITSSPRGVQSNTNSRASTFF